MEQTIADFHEEVSEMMASLKENAEKRHEKLKEIWNNPDVSLVETDNQQNNSNVAKSETEMSEWEKKIEASSSGSKEDGGKVEEDKKEDKGKKKKGFFGRKKK